MAAQANKHEEVYFHEVVGDAIKEATMACQMGGRFLGQAVRSFSGGAPAVRKSCSRRCERRWALLRRGRRGLL